MTLSIGGNDTYFADILEACTAAWPSGNCKDESIDSLPGGTLENTVPDRIANVYDSIVTVLQAIEAHAPNAKILLMGYPEVVSTGCILPTTASAGWIAQETQDMNNTLALAAQWVDPLAGTINFATPFTAFSGHGARASTEYIHYIVTNTSPGETGAVSQQSFHPNLTGATVYANVATIAIAALV